MHEDAIHPSIMDYCASNGYDSAPTSVAFTRRNTGSTEDSGATPIEEYVQEPYEDWTSTHARAACSATLSRGRSIKTLVQRFEELDALETAQVSRPREAGHGLHAPFFKAGRRTSPLRQSIRNFVSVFKKSRRDKDEPTATAYSVVVEHPMLNKDPGAPFCASPSPSNVLHTGTVLHLSRAEDNSETRPLWTQYRAELHTQHLLLSSNTANGLPISAVLPISNCCDVYSISSREVSAEEQALIPTLGESGSPVIFDLVFDDKVERFAVSTAKERAAWVHIILNAVIRSPTSAFSSLEEDEIQKPVLRIDTALADAPALSRENAMPAAPPQLSSLLRRERSLPPLPAGYSTLLSPLSQPAWSSGSHTPHLNVQRDATQIQHPSPTKMPISPSVTNLSRQSMVRQRLAEMERQVSAASETKSRDSRSPFTMSSSSPLRTARTSLSPGLHSSSKEAALPDASSSQTQAPSTMSPAAAFGPRSPFRVRDELRRQRSSVHRSRPEPSVDLMSPDGVAAGTLLDMINDDQSEHTMDDVCEKVDAVANGIGAVRQTLEGVARRGEGDSKLLANLAGRVSEMKSTLERQAQRSTVLHNERPGHNSDHVVSSALREIKVKLDILANTSTVDEILRLARGNEEQRALQATQGAENARYLAELNTWLESFVNHGSSHLEGIFDAVSHITREICPLSTNDLLDGAPAADGPTILGSLHELVARSRVEEQENAAQRQALNELMAAMHEDMRLNAEMREANTTGSTKGHILRQREEYGRMLKTVSDTLFDEIRAERLQFVDAMQEATAINVHRHVDDLKGELAREIATMTQRVAYLQRTSHEWETRIADLLAFYNNQGEQQSQAAQQEHLAPRQQAEPRPAKLDMPRAERVRNSSARPSRIGSVPKLSPIEERSPIDDRLASAPNHHNATHSNAAPSPSRRRPLPSAPADHDSWGYRG